MKRVIVAGHSCVDLIPRLPADPSLQPGALVDIGPLTMQPGGSVVNTGRSLAELGVPVEVVTAIGDDALGGFLRASLADLSPRHSIREVTGVGTSYSLVLEQHGHSRTIWHHIGSAAAFTGDEVDPVGAELVHLGYPTALPGMLTHDAEPLVAMLGRVGAAQATSSVDLSTVPGSQATDHWPALLRRIAPLIDVFTPSADDLVSIGWLTPDPSPGDVADAARRLCDAGAGAAMVSDGARGAALCTGDETRLSRAGRALAPLSRAWAGHASWIAAQPADEVVTTNGAGDTASAGLLFGILNGYAPAEAGRSAAVFAARRVSGLALVDPTTGASSAQTG